ncbi:MAG: CotH kinase family protein, partial [Verrucomicrobiota bacterium]
DIGNIKCWRPRVPNGKFRWIVYDQDYGFHLWRPDVYVPAMARDYASYDNMFAFLTAGTGTGTGWPNEGGRTLMLRRLLANPEVRTRFLQRCADLLNGPFREERVEATIRSMAAVIRPEIPRHLQRWSFAELQKRGYGKPYKAEYEPFTQATWEKNLDSLGDFARRRPAKLRQDCLAHFGLKSGLAQLQAVVSPAGAGQVRLNRTEAAPPPWMGTFFRDVPVVATVVPKPGFRMVGWSGWGIDTAGARWSFQLPIGTNTLTARLEAYSPVPPARPPVILTEIQYHPSDEADSGDWFEVHNPGPEAVDLTGWILRDVTDDHVAVIPGGGIPAGGYAVLCQDTLRFQRAFPAGPVPLGEFGFGLGNGGDTLRIHSADGSLVLRLAYKDSAPWPVDADGRGSTLELKSPGAYSDQPAAWKASSRLGGSPGAANP